MRTGLVLVAVAATFAVATPSWAQPGGGRGGFDRGRAFGMGGLLMSEDVQNEIELVEDQKEELRALAEDMRDEMRAEMGSLFQGMRDMPAEEREARMAEIREKMGAFREKTESRIQDVLLPHQFDRLKQINVQQQLNGRGGTSAGLVRGPLADELGITDEQREELQEKAEKLQAELREKIAKLQEEARGELMEVLTSEQRAKLESMIGDKFEFNRQGFGGDRAGRGPGGRGAQGPGRGPGGPGGGE